MSRTIFSKISFAFVAIILCAFNAQAATSERQCADLIKECFAYSGNERSDCFHAAGGHSFCTGSALGDLAMKRWSMSPIQNPALEQSPAFLGPKVVDGECIRNFDNNWSGALVSGTFSVEANKNLVETLNSCNRAELPVDFTRP